MIINVIEVITYLIVQFSAFYLVYESGRLKEKTLLLEMLKKLEEEFENDKRTNN